MPLRLEKNNRHQTDHLPSPLRLPRLNTPSLSSRTQPTRRNHATFLRHDRCKADPSHHHARDIFHSRHPPLSMPHPPHRRGLGLLHGASAGCDLHRQYCIPNGGNTLGPGDCRVVPVFGLLQAPQGGEEAAAPPAAARATAATRRRRQECRVGDRGLCSKWER